MKYTVLPGTALPVIDRPSAASDELTTPLPPIKLIDGAKALNDEIIMSSWVCKPAIEPNPLPLRVSSVLLISNNVS